MESLSRSAPHIDSVASVTTMLDEAIQLVRQATRVLITGRIVSVQTARAAFRLARQLGATIDCAESGHLFKNTLAIQRRGMNMASIAETRDHADTLIVIGDDRLLAMYPRLAETLARGSDAASQSSPTTVLLLGQFSSPSIALWRDAGFDTWSIETEISTIPRSLLQWLRSSQQAASPWPIPSALTDSRYMTVVWAASNLEIEQADLWVESLLDWISKKNETTRCTALPLSGLDATYQQVGTWLTGFPGRICFVDHEPNYDPMGNAYARWVEESCCRNHHEPTQDLVILIDETAEERIFDLGDYMGPLLTISTASATDYGTLLSKHVHLPAGAIGVHTSGDMFRADQTVLARVDEDSAMEFAHRYERADAWLERLIERC